jgi:hypothetical protein
MGRHLGTKIMKSGEKLNAQKKKFLKRKEKILAQIFILIPKGSNTPLMEKNLSHPLLTQKGQRIQGKNYLFCALNSQKLPFFPV